MRAYLKNSKTDKVILNNTKRQEVQKGIKEASGGFWENEKLALKTMLNLCWISSYQRLQ